MTTYAETAAKKTLTPEECASLWKFVESTYAPSDPDNVRPLYRPAVEALIRSAPHVRETDVEVLGVWPTPHLSVHQKTAGQGCFMWFAIRKDCDNFCLGEGFEEEFSEYL